ncbi:hypothetical protein BofuT4_uP089230.1 [Botrytis cinerea T4]|uniref:Uncharacterized protein n=1 Tax=Botryotinia fuckeliana (strain T4) TaxID=999810 RepID=G2YFH6_BOTF4|nr:hypothetical protein BofuT4_uP089230.1 [Botrytis cinerea T4]
MLHHKVGWVAVALAIYIDNSKSDSCGFTETPRREAFKHDITSLRHISQMRFTEYVTEFGQLQNIQGKIPRATASWGQDL